MSGSPSATMTTDLYSIHLYLNLNRKVSNGSNYFEEMREYFTKLYENNKKEFDALLINQLQQWGYKLETYNIDEAASHQHFRTLRSPDLIPRNKQTDAADAVHIALSIVSSDAMKESHQIELMTKTFALFNQN